MDVAYEAYDMQRTLETNQNLETDFDFNEPENKQQVCNLGNHTLVLAKRRNLGTLKV